MYFYVFLLISFYFTDMRLLLISNSTNPGEKNSLQAHLISGGAPDISLIGPGKVRIFKKDPQPLELGENDDFRFLLK
jgi:hypothetical protein